MFTEVGGIINLKQHKDESFLGHYVESEEKPGKFGPEKIHHFIGEDGAPFSVYGMTALDRSIKQVRPGWFLRITFLGLVPSKKDPTKTYNSVRVEVDPEKSEKSESVPTWDPDAEIPA